MNRSKTKKWAEAKSYNYDGDDWGGYDPYDEYGSYDEPPQQAEPASLRQRQNSFDQGEERRAFSAGTGPVAGQRTDFHTSELSHAAASGRGSQDGRPSSEHGIRRDFSQPGHVPPPLSTRLPPSPAVPSNYRQPVGASFPARKSSLGSGPEMPSGRAAEIAASPSSTQQSTSATKPLPFIRPSDIYKRMEEEKERERQSMDSSRPSMDSIQRPGPGSNGAVDEPIRDRSRSIGRRPSLNAVSEETEHTRAASADVEPLPERKSVYGFEGFTVDNPVLARAIGAKLAPAQSDLPEMPETPLKHESLQSPELTPERLPVPNSPLPRVDRVASGFGSDFWGSTGLSHEPQDSESAASTSLPLQNAQLSNDSRASNPGARDTGELRTQPSLGFQSVVHQAFDKQDDNSVPPTPVSQSNSQSLADPELSRSNTDSTSGISPIMSRVPSAATAEARAHAAESRGTGVPPIAEESSRPTSPDVVSSNDVYQTQHGPALSSHSRNTSAGTQPTSFAPSYRRDMNSPSPNNSPARTPMIEESRRLSNSMEAEFANNDVGANVYKSDHDNRTGLGLSHIVTSPPRSNVTSPDYTRREVDLAKDVASSPEMGSPSVTEAAIEARTGFLKAHSPTAPMTPTSPSWTGARAPSPLAGRESPAPGRVRQMAGKFNEIDDNSRRNSQVSLKSLNSKSSFSSWGRSDDALSLKRTRTIGSPLESPVNEENERPLHDDQSADQLSPRPQMASNMSFRPKLPGEWVSYAPTPAVEREAAFDQDESHSMQPSVQHHQPSSPITPTASKPVDQESIDLTPTTAKQPLHVRKISEEDGALSSAVKAAGSALGAALMASVGSTHQSRDFGQPPPPAEDRSAVEAPRRSAGDVYLRPLHYDRAASSVASSVAPTPPAKDDTYGTQPDRSSGYFPRTGMPEKTTALSPASTNDGDDDLESDRLRREIERSLNPQSDEETMEEEVVRDQDALDGPDNLRQLQQQEPQVHATPELSSPAHTYGNSDQGRTTIPTLSNIGTGNTSDSRRGLLDQRFSWEDKPSGLLNTAAVESSKDLDPDRRKSGLHVVNTNVSEESESSPTLESYGAERQPGFTVTSPSMQSKTLEPPETADHGPSPVSPILGPDTNHDGHDRPRSSDIPPSPIATSPQLDHVKPLPISPTEESAPHRSYTVPDTSTSAPAASDPNRIPPFREILALRSAPERISKYDLTRRQFADMDTGLRDWLSGTIEAHPEHSHIATDGPAKLSNAPMGSIRNRHGPSILKMAKGFSTSNKAEIPPLPSTGSGPATTATSRPTDNLTSSPSQQSGGGVDKFQARGKDLLQTAGMLGGKGMVGAKGWLAKGKKKLRESSGGTDKVD